MISTLLDSFGTVTLEKATLEAVIEDNILQEFTLHIVGSQNIESDTSDVDFTIYCQIRDFNSLDQVNFPDNLTDY